MPTWLLKSSRHWVHHPVAQDVNVTWAGCICMGLHLQACQLCICEQQVRLPVQEQLVGNKPPASAQNAIKCCQ